MLNFLRIVSLFFTFFPFSFDPALYLSLSFMTSHDKARHKTFPSPALGNKWPNKQACNIFVERLRLRLSSEWNETERKDDDV